MSNLASFLEKGLTIANAVMESQQQMHTESRYSEETTTSSNNEQNNSYSTTKTTTTSSSSSSSSLEALNKLFSSAEENMESEQDKQILNHLKTQVSQLFQKSINSNNSAYTTKKTSTTTTTSDGHHYADSDEEEEEGFAERAEHAHLKQLAGDYNTYDKGDDDSASDNDDDDNNNENDGEVKSRGINRNKNHQKGNDGFYTIKKQRHHESSYRKQVCYSQFKPQYLNNLPDNIYCMPMFFPSEESYNNFNSVLASAREKLHIAIFSLTDNATANVLIDAKERGVDVRIVCDNDQLEAMGADIIRLNKNYGIPFKTDSSDQFMHNKFAVIDGKIVITGSFNWSIGARFKNRENIVITNIPEVANSYQEEFDKLWRVIERE